MKRLAINIEVQLH